MNGYNQEYIGTLDTTDIVNNEYNYNMKPLNHPKYMSDPSQARQCVEQLQKENFYKNLIMSCHS